MNYFTPRKFRLQPDAAYDTTKSGRFKVLELLPRLTTFGNRQMYLIEFENTGNRNAVSSEAINKGYILDAPKTAKVKGMRLI